MDDEKIVELYWGRSEEAISEAQKKYGKYCHYIAYNILYSDEDAEECVNDTHVKAWETIPPQRPVKLGAFLGTITRNIALNRYKYNRAEKRSINMETVYDEAKEIAGQGSSGDDIVGAIALKDAINYFVASLPQDTRIIFVRRYWYLSPVKDIAADYKIPEGTVKSLLSRTRKKFKEYLIKEGLLYE
jgi:RNA polymerase sigma-70 factor (ECF subfamily)